MIQGRVYSAKTMLNKQSHTSPQWAGTTLLRSQDIIILDGFSVEGGSIIFGSQRIVDLPFVASTWEGLQSQETEFLDIAVRDRFCAVDEVESVYRSIVGEIVRYYVITSNEVFDVDLIKRLTRIEIELTKQYPHIKQVYEYVGSILIAEHQNIMEDEAKKIYSRL